MKATTKRRSPGEWASLVEEQTHSGQTISHYCQNQELVQATFMYWRKKLARIAGGTQQQPSSSPGFAAIVPRPKAVTHSIILRGRSGVEAEVPPDTPMHTLQALITALSC